MRLNNKAPRHGGRVTETRTYEGAPAYRQTSELELVRLVTTFMFGESKFYESADSRVARMRKMINDLVKQGKADFVAKLGVYARKQMNMRTISIAIQVELARALRANGMSLDVLRNAVTMTISRADEITEMYAYALELFGSKNKVPQAIKKGVGDSFNKFDEYQFAKYNRKNEVKLRDVLRITHARPKNERQSDIFEAIINDTLKTPDTWETKISTGGSTTENWQEVADNPKTGFMALLRNLRNFVDNGVDLTNVIKRLTNPEEVRRSKQFPYRFFTAYKELGGSLGVRSYYSRSATTTANPQLLAALETAFDLSVQNIPDLGDTLLVVDTSGSMTSNISNNSNVMMLEIGAVYAAAVWSASVNRGRNSMIVAFASNGKVINPGSARTPALQVAKQIIREGEGLGGGTNISSAWEAAKRARLTGDTVMVFTDMQFSSFNRSFYVGYGSSRDSENTMKPESYGVAGKDTQKVLFDLQGYGANPYTEIDGWHQLSGWSDKVFDLLETKNLTQVISDINRINLR